MRGGRLVEPGLTFRTHGTRGRNSLHVIHGKWKVSTAHKVSHSRHTGIAQGVVQLGQFVRVVCRAEEHASNVSAEILSEPPPLDLVVLDLPRVRLAKHEIH